MASFLKKFIMNRPSRLKVKDETQLLFLKRLHRLLESGYSLLAALEVMKWDKLMYHIADKLILLLKRGYPIDKAFANVQFHGTIVSYLYFVRINGNLISSLDKSISMFEHRITYIKKFTQVIRYPIILFFVFIFLLLFLKQSVLPSFMELFQSSSDSSTTVLYSIVIIDIMSTIFIVCVMVVLLGTLFWHFYKRKVSTDKQISLYEKLPIYRSFKRMETSYYFATHMSMFLKAGLSIKDILKNMSEQEKLPILAYYAQLMTISLKSGYYIDHLLQSLSLMERQLATIFQKNNNTESLEQDLTTYADFLAENLEQKVLKIITFIQPVFFVTLACFIIFIYITLMWPMFQLIQNV